MTEELARRVVGIIAGADLHPDRNAAASDVDAPADRRRVAEVEPALLSLVCRELNEERKRRGQAQFDEPLVEEHGRKTLSNYYSIVRAGPAGQRQGVYRGRADQREGISQFLRRSRTRCRRV